jgi:hypothetical protein
MKTALALTIYLVIVLAAIAGVVVLVLTNHLFWAAVLLFVTVSLRLRVHDEPD